MNEIMIIACMVCVGYLASLVGLIYGNLKKLEGKIETLEKAPVLRQYIERFVPIDNSEEARKKMADAMAKASTEWNKVFGLGGGSNEELDKEIVRARSDFNEFQKRQRVEDLV